MTSVVILDQDVYCLALRTVGSTPEQYEICFQIQSSWKLDKTPMYAQLDFQSCLSTNALYSVSDRTCLRGTSAFNLWLSSGYLFIGLL